MTKHPSTKQYFLPIILENILGRNHIHTTNVKNILEEKYLYHDILEDTPERKHMHVTNVESILEKKYI